ncbi:MAG: NAD(P)/FAD-dependent oxidoreductase [Clostridia bacterium]|nr:NAD(P)/FAD-dependent oxidoreductase [Clostridia bacterium]
MFDVAVIGGGVIGATILRELTKYRLNVCLLEKEADVAMGQSRANSGIVHAGFDAPVGSLKATFNVLGNAMMEDYARELGVKFKRNGSLVVAFSEEELKTLKELKARGELNGVKKLRIISKEELFEIEPSVSKNAVGALLAPTGGIVCPYKLTVAAVGNAMDNGATLLTEFEVVKINKGENAFTITAKDGKSITAKIMINCAGIYSEEIAKAAGDNSFTVGGRKGEYILLDRECGDFVKHTLFFTPTEKGKGILVSPTVDGNIILGPTAEQVSDKNVETSVDGLKDVQEKAAKMCDKVPFGGTITSFAGTRAYCNIHDFIIEESKTVEGLINCAGIESPGLTSAPAIAKFVVEDLVSKFFEMVDNLDFDGQRKPDDFFNNLSVEEKNNIIKENPAYGKIICRCERITEGEIVRAIKTNPPATNVDAIKRRTRSGMGRCQGGFCQPQVVEIIARELNIPIEQVTKSGKGSYLLRGKTK